MLYVNTFLITKGVKDIITKDVKFVLSTSKGEHIVDVVDSLMPDPMWVLLLVSWSALSDGLPDGNKLVQSMKRSFTRHVKSVVVSVVHVVDSLMHVLMWVLLLVSLCTLSVGLSDGNKLVKSVKISFTRDVKSVVTTGEVVVVETH